MDEKEIFVYRLNFFCARAIIKNETGILLLRGDALKITKNTLYVGVNDHDIDLFEGMYAVPNGMAYNSYLLLDEKIAVMDSVDCRFSEKWLENIRNILGEKPVDFLIVQHMEPDHSGSVSAFAKTYPNAKIVASQKAFVMMKNYFGEDFDLRKVVVGENDTLVLGEHTLRFFTAPMVHWPEVIMTYNEKEKILFSADAFGKFGALDKEDDWDCEARRYYFGIVGKYGAQVQAVLKKLQGLEIRAICPLHGPVLQENLSYFLHLYDVWSSYGVEEDGIVIAYTSVYGNTKRAVQFLAQKIKERGVKVALHDLARVDMTEAVEDAFRYGKIVLATTTYNGGIFPFMREFIHDLTERKFENRDVAFIENGSWAPMAIKVMQGMLEKCKNLRFIEPSITILSGVRQDTEEKLEALAEALCK